MANLFHKSVYTTRSIGYKYRTLATNTTSSESTETVPPAKPKKYYEENPLDVKFRNIKHEIISRVNKQIQESKQAREINFEKFERVMEKITRTVELKDTMAGLQETLSAAEGKLADLMERVDKLNQLVSSESSSSE